MTDLIDEIQDTQQANQPYDYLIIGGGIVGGYAAESIRELDKDGTIGIVSTDMDEPYTRPALSKLIWTSDTFTEKDVPFGTAEKTSAEIMLETEAIEIDRNRHTVQLSNGRTIGYIKLLIATGSEPNKIQGPEDDHVIYFRSFEDYRKLRRFSGKQQHVIVVGGGYIGSELAAALIQNNTRVTYLYPDNVLFEKKFPKELTEKLESTFRDAGVEMVNNSRVSSYRKEDDDTFVLTLESGKEIQGDTIVFGLGVTPRLSLAEKTGLTITDGVVVNNFLQTDDPDIYAAGDIVSYIDPIFGRKRIEHVDHARKSGAAVGKIMAGSKEPYNHTPYFYSHIFDISWQALGTLDPELDLLSDTVGDGKIFYYLKNDKPIGALIWRADVDLDDVRHVLDNPPTDSKELKGLVKEKD
ncbi:MAG: NAD(P)/FAD-dependent oxidoreductase [Pisciglobus halotolerans]|nr:NAD(P)/FAD-dependent oxidoreductase [Pisciglobus halotolerans]